MWQFESLTALKSSRKSIESKHGNKAKRIGEKDCELIDHSKKREEGGNQLQHKPRWKSKRGVRDVPLKYSSVWLLQAPTQEGPSTKAEWPLGPTQSIHEKWQVSAWEEIFHLMVCFGYWHHRLPSSQKLQTTTTTKEETAGSYQKQMVCGGCMVAVWVSKDRSVISEEKT